MAKLKSGMTLGDSAAFALSDLGRMKLRASLTAFGVAVGIGALFAMVGFGKGMQKNVTESFAKLDLFNSITVLPPGSGGRFTRDPDDQAPVEKAGRAGEAVLDDEAVRKLAGLSGVVTAFPEIRFPVMVRFRGKEDFVLAQVVPAKVAASRLLRLQAGETYGSDDEESVIVSASLLRRLEAGPAASVVGEKLELASVALDPAAFNPAQIGAYLSGAKLPFAMKAYPFAVAGVTELMDFAGPVPLGGDLILPPGPAGRMDKLPFTNVWDLFRARGGKPGYGAVNLRIASPSALDAVKAEVKKMGFSVFALLDRFEQIRSQFVYMDMALASIGMIAIFVAALGIVNTMVMSVLERYVEIGIMKAVGAARRDIQRVFFFESGSIGLLGGLGGLALGWAVSRVINEVVNSITARQGVPRIAYFSYPAWLWLGAVGFAVLVSLAAGILPARRAARVDPVVALRHE